MFCLASYRHRLQHKLIVVLCVFVLVFFVCFFFVSLRSRLWCLFCPCVLPCVALFLLFSMVCRCFASALPFFVVPFVFALCCVCLCCPFYFPTMIACVSRFHVALLYVALALRSSPFTLLSLTLFSLYVELTAWRNTLLAGGGRPGPVEDPRPPQVRVQRHTVEQVVDLAPMVRILGDPVPQMVDQLVEVFSPLDITLPEEVRTVVSPSFFLQLAEQNVGIPVPGARGFQFPWLVVELEKRFTGGGCRCSTKGSPTTCHSLRPSGPHGRSGWALPPPPRLRGKRKKRKKKKLLRLQRAYAKGTGILCSSSLCSSGACGKQVLQAFAAALEATPFVVVGMFFLWKPHVMRYN